MRAEAGIPMSLQKTPARQASVAWPDPKHLNYLTNCKRVQKAGLLWEFPANMAFMALWKKIWSCPPQAPPAHTLCLPQCG